MNEEFKMKIMMRKMTLMILILTLMMRKILLMVKMTKIIPLNLQEDLVFEVDLVVDLRTAWKGM